MSARVAVLAAVRGVAESEALAAGVIVIGNTITRLVGLEDAEL
jgi:hypothetical protein